MKLEGYNLPDLLRFVESDMKATLSVESMLGDKYRDVFNNHHDLNLGSSGKTTTIEIPIEIVEKLHNIAKQIEKITSKKHVTPSQVIGLLIRQAPSAKH